ncbi:MAG: hypothetical protein ACRD20_20500 [Terriglobales bacterium]
MADETQKQGEDLATSDADEALLKQIREDFRYVREYWRDNYDEAEKDMDFVACKPPTEFVDDRKGRPTIWPDEISQYVKQANNNLRQNKRSVKISPRSEDATDQDAEHRQAYIRGIEYASKAQSIYATACEAAIECGFGFWRVTTVVTGPNGEQEPRLRRIPNQFTVYLDPDAREADFSDGCIAFVLDRLRKNVFARKYPDAKKRSFTGSDVEKAPDWFHGEDIIVAEYWTREEQTATDGEKHFKVTQRITNGVEILETNDWIGSWIPLNAVIGEEMYVRNGGNAKRMILSLVRRARAPQQMLAYVASQEAEEFSMAPRAPMMVVEGSVDPEQWKFAHKVPTAYLEYKIPPDWNAQTMGNFPPPVRSQFQPNPQAYEMSREAWRRAIQAAMGLTPLPTAAQRQNEKSGIALEKIQTQESIGTYHFTDNFVRALSHSGMQLNELVTKLAELDSLPKQLLGKDDKEDDMQLRVAPQQGVQDLIATHNQGLAPDSEHLKESDFFFAHRGKFELTISDGPSYLSQREEQAEFADTIFKAVEAIAGVLPPGTVGRFLALAIKLKNIGAIGDEMQKLLAPDDQSAQQLQQAQQGLAMAQQQLALMKQELDQLKLEKAGKVLDNEYKLKLKEMEGSFDAKIAQLNADIKVLIAEIQTKAQDAAQRNQLFQETQIENHHAAHDIALQKDDQAHQQAMADKNAVIAQSAAAAQAATNPQPDSDQGSA